MNRISFLNRGYAFKGLLAVLYVSNKFHARCRRAEYVLNAFGARFRHASERYMRVPILRNIATVSVAMSVYETRV